MSNPLDNLPPDVQRAIKDFFVVNKGVIPSRLAKHAYFNQRYAEKARDIIDEVLMTRKPYRIPLEEGYSIHALRNQWYEGSRYLRAHMDPKGKYHQALIHMKCRTEYDYIEIIPRQSLRGALLAATTSGTVSATWREEFKDWLMSEPELESKFHKKDVVLADSDILWGHEQLIGIEKMFYAKFERNEILVVRFDHD